MVPLLSLAVPILLAGVIVFVASSIMHMVLPYHRSDFRGLPKEDDVLEALRRAGIPPGDYVAPHAGSPAGMKNPQFVEKMTKGPLLIMTVAAGEPPSMSKSLVLWFLYTVLVSMFTAYVVGRAVGPGTPYLRVFQLAGAVAFMGYSLALLQQSIWLRRSWTTTMKSMVDGLVYGLLTAGTFGWLWPR
jgi:hypothetical protein